LLLLAIVGCVDPNAPVNPNDTTEFVYEVPKGATAGKLGEDLVAKGLAPSAFAWKMFLRKEDATCLKAGKFRVRRSMSLHELKETLCGVPLADDVPFTVVEGWRIRDIDEALAAKGWIVAGEYQKLAEAKSVDLPFDITSPTLEGYLSPETYMVTPDRFTAKGFIERQLQTFDDRFLKQHVHDCEARGLQGVVTMASMLEREEPDPANRSLVAGILWKRIDHGWQLGVDATSRYELADWNDRDAFIVHLKDPDDPYNTRIHHGLPPTAIGNPGITALEAAIAPTASDYWFYLHDSQQRFHGGRNAAEHDANRAKYGVY
jgi:UPF0755 protein